MDEALQKVKIKEIAKKIMFSSKNSLIVHLRFLDAAINKLPLTEYDEYVCVDGKTIKYNPRFILQCYSFNKNLVTRTYLHMILHCTFTHFYVGPHIIRDLWDIACDAAVENILEELSTTEDYIAVEHTQIWHDTMAAIKENVNRPTAEKIYRYYVDQKLSEKEIEQLYGVFLADDHSVWYENTQKEEVTTEDQDDNEDPGQYTDESDEDEETSGEKTQGQSSSPQKDDDQESETKGSEDSENSRSKEDRSESEGDEPDNSDADDGKNIDREMQQKLNEWEEVSKHMELDLETFSKEKGSRVGDLLLNIKNVTREKYDYTSFLKKFASMGEKIMLDDNEFDYIYYTYGLSFYHNMPLVEPLEYKETNVVKEFVIALDTSFSVHGDEVQSFVRKTYNILKATESFSSKINLHIIQCDTKVQHDEKITTQAELDRYMKDMMLYGFGGTDFRPVFEYVDKLIADKEFTNLKGLIYFTDGFGTFPQRPPAYKTAFAFVSDDIMFDPVVPPWAIKLIIDPEDIKEDKL